MCRHALADHALQSGQTDAVLVLKELAHTADPAVAQVVDIVIRADAVLYMHVVVDRRDDILLGDMLGHKLVYASAQHIAQGLGILTVALLEGDKDLAESGIIDLLRDAELSGIAVDIVGQVNHEVGQDLDVALIRSDHDIGDSRVLDEVGHLTGHGFTGTAQNIPVCLIDNVLGENVTGNPAAHCQFLVEFISADFGQIISPGIKEHGVDQAVRALNRERLAGTNFLIEFKETGLEIMRGILGKAGPQFGLIAEEIDDLLIGTDAERAHQNSDRHLPGPVYTDIKDVIGVCLILQPGSSVGDHGAGEEFLAEFILVNPVIDAGGTNQLADDDTLRAVDDKGAVPGHKRKVSHEDLLLLDLAVILLVIQANTDFQGRRVSPVTLFALLNRIFHIFLSEPVPGKSKAEMSAEVFNRRNIVQNLLKALVTKPLIGVLLNFDQIRHRKNFFLALIAHPDVLATACRM